MPRYGFYAAVVSLLFLLSVAALVAAEGQAQPTPAPQNPVAPILPEALGKLAFTQWSDGVEKELPAKRVIWRGDSNAMDWEGIAFGDSKVPGKRHLRIAFEKPVEAGSVLVMGGGALSVLKPGLPVPGDPADDAQWVAAERLQDGAVTGAEVVPDKVALWVLPPHGKTSALRFTHIAQPSETSYAGRLGGLALFSGRLADLGPQAVASARSCEDKASRLNDESPRSCWDAWANEEGGQSIRPLAISGDPEWLTLVWPKPVTLRGLGFFRPGFSKAEIQTFSAPKNKPPKLASEADWKTVQTLDGLKCHYCYSLDLEWRELDKPLTTRAIRVRITAPLSEEGFHPHMVGKTNGGKRVWLGSLLPVQALGDEPLASAILPTPKPAEVHAPIPVSFNLPEDGNVTLVIEDHEGRRVRNLISDTPMKKGKNTVYWDGTDDLGRDPDDANHGIYSIPVQFVAPGDFTVRGLWHKPIDLRYEMTFYSPGDPPWPTADSTGGWMTNHTPASAAAFVPGAKAPGGVPVMLIGSYVSEGGSALSWINADGKKIGGRGWIGGNWTGAQYLATDTGPNAERGVAAYVGAAWRNQKDDKDEGTLEIRLTKLGDLTSGTDKPVLTPVLSEAFPPLPPRPDGKANERDLAPGLGGLAVRDGLMVISVPMLDELVFIDSKKGEVLGKAPLAKPRGLAFDVQGRLLVLADKSLLRYTLAASPAQLGAPETLAANLEEPCGITVDPSGKIYVSDRGNSNQVKVFSPDGHPEMVYGQPGPVAAGPYNPLHMNRPKGIAIDSNQRLWVTEEDYQPKRVSVWNPDGSLWKAYYGPPQYGGGGVIDPRDASKILYNGMEFHADIPKGESGLARVYWRNKDSFKMPSWGDAAPEMPAYFHGRRYLTNIFNANPTNGTNIGFLFLDKGEIAVPVAACGRANDWPLLQGDAFKKIWPPGIDLKGDLWKNLTFFTWSDLNGDGEVQPDEVKMWPLRSGAVTLGDDGSFLVSSLGPDKGPFQAMRFKPVAFTDKDVPVYDGNAGEPLAPAQETASDGGGQILAGTDGWLVQTTAPPPFSNLSLGGSKNGKPAWSYPSLWPGLHPSHSCPPADHRGQLLGTTRLLGNLVTPKGSDAGPLFVINGNQGNLYCFTQDGLFVAQFFQDVRGGRLWQMPLAQREMLLNDLTLHDENFFPAVSQTPEGQVYLMAGAIPAVVRVDGLGSLRRIAPIPLEVTAKDLKLAKEFTLKKEAARQAAAGNGVMNVALDRPSPVLDGKLEDWSLAAWVPIDRRGVAAYFDSNSKPYNVTGAVAVADGKLFAAWKTGDPQLLRNSGAVPNGLFKTGGALDLMIGADAKADPNRSGAVAGDIRLLVTLVDGKTCALLYRAVVPGTAAKDKVPFSAPWHSITMDRVEDVSGKVQLAADSSGNYELSVPLDLLGLKPESGARIKADIGILRGDGAQTTQRVYWSNKATAIVSDVPSEAELTPRLWGVWEFTPGK